MEASDLLCDLFGDVDKLKSKVDRLKAKITDESSLSLVTAEDIHILHVKLQGVLGTVVGSRFILATREAGKRTRIMEREDQLFREIQDSDRHPHQHYKLLQEHKNLHLQAKKTLETTDINKQLTFPKNRMDTEESGTIPLSLVSHNSNDTGNNDTGNKGSSNNGSSNNGYMMEGGRLSGKSKPFLDRSAPVDPG